MTTAPTLDPIAHRSAGGVETVRHLAHGRVQEAVVDKLAANLAKDLPGFSIGISQPIIDGVNDMIGGAHSPLVIKIYGDDLNELRRIGGRSWPCSIRSRDLERIGLPGAAHSPDRGEAGS